MMSITRILALGAVLFAAGCPAEPGSKLCPTGILCPEDMQCGAVEAVCLTNGCGNGFRDGGEDCDDGNITEGDGCSAICRTEACGNNVKDPGELCDDGNAVGGDGCSADCRSMETCGNGIRDMGEACDDSNLVNGDGCTGEPVTVGGKTSPEPCMSREVCGNGIVDFHVGEVCDDSNMVSGDGCNSDCRSGEGCGNGFVDPGEQCDDGDQDNNDTCLNTCKTAVCGDGVVDATDEMCDAGTTGVPVETATCNIDCTTRSCGDGKVNQTSGEQCDNGIGMNGDTRNCTAGCVLNVCGDGHVDSQIPGVEACDDGNTNNTDGCSNACALASCGNSTVDSGEQCDDGNTTDTDACVACVNAVCGDGKVRAGVEVCDDGNVMNGDGCSNNCRPEGCGNGILDPLEQCDDGNAANDDACVTGCKIAICGDMFIRDGVEMCDDGNLINGDMCSSQCRLEGCGNGTLDPGEACDDGNMTSGDGCSFPNCRFEGCGDGFVNNGEACDGNGAGVGGETAACNVDCTMRRCGDAKVNATAGEQCDAGTIMGVNQNSDDRDCTAACRINICTDGKHNTVGPLHIETCDDGNTIATDGCSNSCSLASCGNGIVDPMEDCDDLNILNTDSCVACKNARCGDNFVETGVEECDGSPVGGQPCSLPTGSTPGCKRMRCGNGIVEAGEQCDNDVVGFTGTPMGGDGCTSACVIEFCGDGVDNNNNLEECDPGASGESSGCNRDCSFATCGDGIVNIARGELCDDGGLTSGDGCSGNEAGKTPCRFERCGNGVLDVGEECEGSSGTCLNCLLQSCGNNRRENWGPNAEQCDAATLPTRACSATCQTLLFCGDGTVSAGESCEPPGTATCNYDCSTSVCGDSKVNPLSTVPAGGEQCDGGPGASTGVAAQTATCDTNCTPAVCGDSTENSTALEECDLGASNSFTAACLPGCIDNDNCGDGIKGPSEFCDEGLLNNTACPYGTSCARCNSTCTAAVADPNGPRCGDSTVQAGFGEQCDGSTTATCAMFGHTTGTVTCGTDCNLITTGCSTPTVVAMCGNGMLEAGEMCDEGANNAMSKCLGGSTTPGYNMSCVTCSASCMVLPLMGPYCGDNMKNGTETCDGSDIASTNCVGAGFNNPGMGMGTPACQTGCAAFAVGTCAP